MKIAARYRDAKFLKSFSSHDVSSSSLIYQLSVEPPPPKSLLLELLESLELILPESLQLDVLVESLKLELVESLAPEKVLVSFQLEVFD